MSTKAPLKPIICTTFWGRVQIDLIDMRKYHFEEYTWLLSVKDHFTRFVILHALKSKTGKEVVAKVRPCYLGCMPGATLMLPTTNKPRTHHRCIRLVQALAVDSVP